ncbi:MAG: hypothetical protein WB630_16315 [Candidatus Acidiferrales bacterium]
MLHVLQALRQQFGVAAIEADVILSGGAGIESDCAADDKGDGLGFSFADAFRCGAAASRCIISCASSCARVKAEAEAARAQAEKTALEARKLAAELRQGEADRRLKGALNSSAPAAMNVPIELIIEESKKAAVPVEYSIILINRTLPTLLAIQNEMRNTSITMIPN